MKKLLPLLLVLSACGSADDPQPEPELKVELGPASNGFAFLNPRVEDEDVLVLDLHAAETVEPAYGLAMRLRIDGADFAGAEPSQSWTISRFEPAAMGAVGVWSKSGSEEPVSLSGLVGTIRLELEEREPGSAEMVPEKTAVLDADGAAVPAGWASVSWTWE